MATRTKARKPSPRKAAKKVAGKAKRSAPSPRVAKKTAVRPQPATPVRKERRVPESLRLRSASPALTVNDIARSLAWYRDVLGFHVKDRWEQEGKLMGVELVAGSAVFMLSQDDWKKGRDRKKGEGLSLYCITIQDVDRLAAQVKAQGGTLLQEPRDQEWGMRDFAVADPDGFKITIGNVKR